MAPLSQAPPLGRVTPRWSMPVQVGSPVLMAGEPGWGRWVLVGPPLVANGPSRAGVPWVSPVLVNPHVVSLAWL